MWVEAPVCSLGAKGFSEAPIWFTYKQYRPTYKPAIASSREYLTVEEGKMSQSCLEASHV